MDTLRDRFVREMTIRGFAESTKANYLHDVELMIRRTGLHPSQITSERAAEYFEWMIRDHKASPSTYRQHLRAAEIFFQSVVKRDLEVFTHACPRRRHKLPSVLQMTEVRRLLAGIQVPKLRVAATVQYSCGLRIGELLRMQSSWIVSESSQLHAHDGKGGSDRLVPLPSRTVAMLREHWRRENLIGPLLFPSPRTSERPMDPCTLRRAIRLAAREAGITHHVSSHTLRHSYATHLLENGVDIRLIQRFLGHRSLQTTSIYAHLTKPVMQRAYDVLERMTRDL